MRDEYDTHVPVMTALFKQIASVLRGLVQEIIQQPVSARHSPSRNPGCLYDRRSVLPPRPLLLRYSRVFALTPHYIAKFDSVQSLSRLARKRSNTSSHSRSDHWSCTWTGAWKFSWRPESRSHSARASCTWRGPSPSHLLACADPKRLQSEQFCLPVIYLKGT